MISIALKRECALMLVIGGILAAGPVMADKPSWAGQGNGKKHERGEQRDDRHDRDSRSDDKRIHFEDRQRIIVREYYGEQFSSGHCPPGLAKKHNGCMPPGQAKKWKVGKRLPHDVVYYEVPPPLVARLGPPPSGYRYVRVASDVLIIAVGTGMILDAIQDLGR